MCLISHNLPVETARSEKKPGTSFFVILAVRLTASFAGAFALNLLLPPDSQVLAANSQCAIHGGGRIRYRIIGLVFRHILFVRQKSSFWSPLLMILQRIMETFGIMRWLSGLLKYPLMLLGIPHEAAFLWIVANTIGLAYGAGGNHRPCGARWTLSKKCRHIKLPISPYPTPFWRTPCSSWLSAFPPAGFSFPGSSLQGWWFGLNDFWT